MHHVEGFDFVPGNRSFSAVEMGLVNVLSRETDLKRYLDEIKRPYDYLLLDCRPSRVCWLLMPYPLLTMP